MAAILIKNGTVYDGTGAPPKRTDILIERDHIARLGDFGRREAERIVDATGAAVMPGIIEVDFEPEGEEELFSEGLDRRLLARGVTTVIDGADGTAFAPVIFPLRRGSRDWQTLGEFWRAFQRRPIGVNFGTLIGYAGLRRAFTAGRERDLDLREMGELRNILRRGISDGALGIGLGNAGELRLPEWELLAIAEEAARGKLVLALHLDDGEGMLGENIARVLAAAKKSGASVELSHFEPMKASSDVYRSALIALEKQAARANVDFDIFPLASTRFPITAFFPIWIKGGTPETVLADISASHAKDRLLTHLKKLPLAELRVIEVPRHLRAFQGKRIGELAASWGTRPERAFLRLAIATRLICRLADPKVDREVLESMLANPRSILTLSFHEAEAGNDLKGTFAAAASGGKLAEEQVIAKLTGAPAKKFGLARRGLIAPDHFADIVILRDERVQTVFVNGSEVWNEGVLAAKRVGVAIRRGK